MQGQEYIYEYSERQDVHKARLDSILSRELNPDSIDDYAEQALADLIDLVQEAINSFGLRDGFEYTSNRETEDAAFRFYGLGNVEIILDHIAEKSQELSTIDKIIADSSVINKTIVPTDTSKRGIIEGKGPFMDFVMIPRVKTTLFVLANDFNINIEDSSQIQVQKGQMKARTIRQESYYSIDVAPLCRTILVCDERRNATYVFDDEALTANGISNKDLLSLTKTELDCLISERPDFGVKLKYTNRFVPRLLEAIQDPKEAHRESRGTRKTDSYLYPKAPEGTRSLSEMAKFFGKYPQAITEVISELGDDVGDVQMYRFGTSAVANGYTPEQQEIIRFSLDFKGKLAPKAPEGILSESGLSKKIGVSQRFLHKAAYLISDELGEVKTYKFYVKVTKGFDQAQQEKIREHLEYLGALVDIAPECYLPARRIAETFGVAVATVAAAIEDIGEQLGEITRYRFKTRIVAGYSPEQQNKIYDYLKNKGIFDSEKATDDIRSEIGIARNLGISNNAVSGAINKLDNRLGDIGKYTFGPYTIDKGYTIEQQVLIKQQLLTGPRAKYYAEKFREDAE